MNTSEKSLPKFLLLSFLPLLVLAGCDKIPFIGKKAQAPAPVIQNQPVQVNQNVEVKGTVIAKVNNSYVTLEDLKSEIDTFNATVETDNPEEKIDKRDKKITYLKEGLIRKILLYQLALSRSLDKKEDIRKAIENLKQNLLVAELVREETLNVEPTAADIENYYNQNKDRLKDPEERRIREIVVANEDQIKEVNIELLKGADFSTLAQEKSIAASAKQKGDLGYVKMGSKFAQFDAVAFSPTLDIGKISSYFKGPDGYYIVKIEDRRGGKAKSLAELSGEIKKALTFYMQQQKIEDLIKKIESEAKIEIHEGLID
jgi:parvulin-like peptidyl-prolyl isomerase